MGWLDKGLKNIFKGGKDLLSSPAGIMALGVLAPYAAPWMKGLGATQGLGFMKSPMVSNALKNAAMNYGIATLTGSKHPEKSALWAGAASLPFTYMKGAQAAKGYNLKRGLTGADKASWADIATGKIMPGSEYSIPGAVTKGYDIPKGMEGVYPGYDVGPSGYTEGAEIFGAAPRISTPPSSFGTPTTGNVPDMPYFTRDPSALQAAGIQQGGVGSLPAMLGLENIDVMASLVPQVAGLYGGRMSEEEQWLASQEKQIRMWAFQFGIPYEEAKEIWKEGWKNPYYTTQTPTEYGDFRNRGGYIDDYTAGGKAVGPGTGKSDSIQPVALSNGEFVFTEEATNKFPGGADGLYSLMNRLDPDSETPTEARA
jgi:hypothetical protein